MALAFGTRFDGRASVPDDVEPNDYLLDVDSLCKLHISELDRLVSFPSPGDYGSPASPQFRRAFDSTFDLVIQLYDRIGPEVSVLFTGVSASDLTPAQLRTLMLRKDFYWAFVKDSTLISSTDQLREAASVLKRGTRLFFLSMFIISLITIGLGYFLHIQSAAIGHDGHELASLRDLVEAVQLKLAKLTRSHSEKNQKHEEDARAFRAKVQELNESSQAETEPPQTADEDRQQGKGDRKPRLNEAREGNSKPGSKAFEGMKSGESSGQESFESFKSRPVSSTEV
jgi:Skp family chaperone for outer membrane proteins